MDKSSGGMDKGIELKPTEGGEQMPGMKIERVELGEFIAHESQIKQLRFNVLGGEDENVHKKVTSTERRQELKPMRQELRKSSEHEAIYLAKDKNDKIVGFMFIELDPNGRHAHIKEMWSSKPEGSQGELIRRLLDAAKGDLPDDRYPHLDVEASVTAKHFKHLAANPTYKFLRIKDASSKPEGNDNSLLRHDIEKAA